VLHLDPGDNVRQGDIYVTRLGDRLPAKAGAYEGRQLAPGPTQGSRHVIVGPCTLYRPDESEAAEILGTLVPQARGQRLFIGPVIEATDAVTLEHPEHPHRTLPPGNYLVTYQRSYQDEMRRAQD
jgi:hypothetical protein